jgi:hypothetical protein
MKDKSDQVCVVVNNELVCVEQHSNEAYEKKVKEKKLHKALKYMKKDRANPDKFCQVVDNQYIADPHN